MQFRNFAENLLGTKVKIKLLKYILSEGAVTSEREIARLIGISAGAVNKTLKELYDLNIVCPTRIGNVTAWQLNEKSYAHEYIMNFFNKLKSREEPLIDLQAQIRNLSYLKDIKKAILFGSVAEGRELPESDIDIAFFVETEKDRKNIALGIENFSNLCIGRYGNKPGAHIFTPNDVKHPKNKKFIENVMKGIRVIDR